MTPTQTVQHSQTPTSCLRRGYRTTSVESGSRRRHTRRPAEVHQEGCVFFKSVLLGSVDRVQLFLGICNTQYNKVLGNCCVCKTTTVMNAVF